jgi:NADP-dependent 3-hydroxy acid dehydrogenase YdfG
MTLSGMVARGRGHIVTIGSTAGAAVFAGTGPYAAAKAGLAMAAALCLREHANVSVLEIVPTDQAVGGYVYTKRS